MNRSLEAVAVAHPNIALSKYWGKREVSGNYPAVPSLSVTLAGMATRTRVRFDPALAADRLVLGGVEATGAALVRAGALLARVREHAECKYFAEVESENDFPTASGLASSASGFAALALAATRAAGLDWDAARVSDLARRSSASAARSLFGGFVELPGLPAGSPAIDLAASPVAAADHVDLRVLVCVTTEAQKEVGSTDGMRVTAEKSPYYGAWLTEAPRLHARLRDALLAKDFQTMGELAESSALAMHASALAAGVLYFSPATVAALAAIRALRTSGVAAYATIDAGPHVKVLVRGGDAARTAAHLREVPGVLRLIETRPGEGARVVDALEQEASR